ncbi:hypothetical protein P3T21_007431 [Paraburkholderia sp. GAS334]|jgi:hypothetical protein
MIGLRYTRKSRDGLRLISVAALFGLAGICHAQSPAKVQDTGVDANPPSITTSTGCNFFAGLKGPWGMGSRRPTGIG